ncbi:MAG: ABC transporter ATP-binding protein, partial [Actinobacteria bacterium]|nr:ABC transporter ATP-binding protein [Actinomycetota bacterium]
PKVLLLDEPLGALDAKLRRVLQVELRSLHREVGITFVYVTHDQEEALTMSDRLAVMNTGRIEQVGGPRSVYDEPANRYVADFLGLANLLPATADAAGVTVLGARVAADTRGLAGASTVLVRPERVQLVAPSSGQLQGRVQHVVFAGAATHVHMRVGDHDLQAVVPNDGSALAAVEGGDVGLVLAADALRVLAD